MASKQIKNTVAKFSKQINRAQTHRDRKNDYTRKAKHRNLKFF